MKGDILKAEIKTKEAQFSIFQTHLGSDIPMNKMTR